MKTEINSIRAFIHSAIPDMRTLWPVILILFMCLSFTAHAQNLDTPVVYKGINNNSDFYIITVPSDNGLIDVLFFKSEQSEYLNNVEKTNPRQLRGSSLSTTIIMNFSDTSCILPIEDGNFTLQKVEENTDDLTGHYLLETDENFFAVMIIKRSGLNYTVLTEMWEKYSSEQILPNNGNSYTLPDNPSNHSIAFSDGTAVISDEDGQEIVLRTSEYIKEKQAEIVSKFNISITGSPKDVFTQIYHQPYPPSADIPASRLKRSEFSMFSMPISSISPNGTRAISTDKEFLYVYDIALLKELYRIPVGEAKIDPGTIVWSNDSSKIAGTENFFMFMMEPDIHLFDLSDGTYINLTDDHTTKTLIYGGYAAIDITPCWVGRDGNLLFQRIIKTDGFKCDLILYDFESNEPVTLYENIASLPALINIIPSQTNGKLYLSFLYPERFDKKSGIWQFDLANGQLTPIEGLSGSRKTPILYDVSFNGRYLLIQYPVNLNSSGRLNDPEIPVFTVYDTSTGEERALLELSEEYSQPQNAAFSPDGNHILYVYSGFDKEKTGAAIQDTEGSAEKIIYSCDDRTLGLVFPSTASYNTGTAWSINDTIFLARETGQEAVFIQIE